MTLAEAAEMQDSADTSLDTVEAAQHRPVKRHTSFTVVDILSPTKFTKKTDTSSQRPDSVLDQTDPESGKSFSEILLKQNNLVL